MTTPIRPYLRFHADPMVDVMTRKDLNLFTKIICSSPFEELVNVSLVCKDWKEVADADPRWKEFALALVPPHIQELPPMHYKNLFVLSRDIKMKIEENNKDPISSETLKEDNKDPIQSETLKEDNKDPIQSETPKEYEESIFMVSRIAFVALSQEEGILKLYADKGIGKLNAKYIKLSQDELASFLKVKCSDHQQWNSLLSKIANSITYTCQHYLQMCSVFSPEYLQSWKNLSQESKAKCLSDKGISDLFLLPSTESALEFRKLQMNVKENTPGIIVQYDPKKCEKPISTMISILGTKRESDELKTGILLEELAKTVELEEAVIEIKNKKIPAYKVKFDQNKKMEVLTHISASQILPNKFFGVINHEVTRAAVVGILGEIYGQKPCDNPFYFQRW